MGGMPTVPVPALSRRSVLICGAAVALAPLPALSAGVCTPRELALRFDAAVTQKLQVPQNEVWIYAGLAEAELAAQPDGLAQPQYLLVVDSCAFIQTAFLFWRLLPGRYELVGAAPASTGSPLRPGCLETPCGVFPQASVSDAGRALSSRVYDFGMHRARRGTGAGYGALHLQARAAVGRSRALLGTPQSDGRVLLPASLVAFLDAYGVLDAQRRDGTTPDGEPMPFAGQYLVVIDSEREERPDWAIAA
jgi:hypothetical protein